MLGFGAGSQGAHAASDPAVSADNGDVRRACKAFGQRVAKGVPPAAGPTGIFSTPSSRFARMGALTQP